MTTLVGRRVAWSFEEVQVVVKAQNDVARLPLRLEDSRSGGLL